MKRHELVISRWNELERHQQLRWWQPEAGCRNRPHIGGQYSRQQAIEILEDSLTRRREKGLNIENDDPLSDALETELMAFYRDLDGQNDRLPLAISCAPKIVHNLMPEMLVEYLKQWNADSPIMITGLRDSIVQDYLCELTGLTPKQLVLSKQSGCLVISDTAAETDQVFPFPIPDWLVAVNELVLLDWRQDGLMNVRQLREHLIREVQNSTRKMAK